MIPQLRVRLTAIYGGVLFVFVAFVLGLSYWLMGRHLHRTLGELQADAAQSQLAAQYLLALAGVTLVSVALGWALAGRELGSMQAAFDARERFVANASHELRSPLTVIRTEADVALADPDASTGELRAMGEQVIAAADRMDDLLDGLMVLAMSERPEREPVDLAAVVAEAAASVRREGVTVRLDLRPAEVRGERRMLARLAANLIDNGVRYGRSVVTVSACTLPDAVEVAVEDDGPGIESGERERVFELFTRGRAGLELAPDGTGFGLALVRRIAVMSGGSIRYEPAAPRGSRFVLSLPKGSV